jgi:Protein of Unknown function (DUF2784)
MIADLIVIIHFGFILFVVFGGFLTLKWHNLIWLHLPAAIWGVIVELFGWFCPLTYYENSLRQTGGGGYTSGFLEHYLMPMIYPSALSREIQIGLGIILAIFNLLIYRKLYLERNGSR